MYLTCILELIKFNYAVRIAFIATS